jgi:hypothetical protein
VIYIQKRDDSGNCFPPRVDQNHHRAERVAVVRRVGPRWVTAGRRPRAIPVFFIRRTILSVTAPIVRPSPSINAGAMFGGAGR